MMDNVINRIPNWEYKDLRDFVNNPAKMENDIYEFKGTYKLKPKELRKCFSSFANSKGGVIFFGIDNNKNICGIEEDPEINTYINRTLNNQALQPPIKKWELINSIYIPKTKPKKYVYICYVHPSLPKDRPHIADEKIYIRQNGEAKPIFSGIELRRHFFLSKFYPEHIELLEYELDKIRKYEYKSSELDVMYLEYLKQYIREGSYETKDLLSNFNAMVKLIDKINHSHAILHSSTGVPQLSMPSGLKDKYDKLKKIVEDFIIKFKRIHNL